MNPNPIKDSFFMKNVTPHPAGSKPNDFSLILSNLSFIVNLQNKRPYKYVCQQTWNQYVLCNKSFTSSWLIKELRR